MRKVFALFLVVSMILGMPLFSMAEGIGSPDAPVKVTILEKDVLPDEEDVQLMAEAIEQGMAAQGNYVEIEYLEAPAGKYVDVVPLALRTGQFSADIVYMQNGVELELVQEGLLADLTDYVNNSTYVKALYKDYNWSRLEEFPYLLWLCPAFTYTPNIRTDIFNQLDSKDAFMADPTPDNFYALLCELKEKGLAEYPLTTDNNKLRLDGFMNQAFGIETSLMKVDGKWIFAEVSEGTKAKLSYLNKLYTDGLLDPEFITNVWDVMEQRYYEGISAIISARVGATTKIHDDKMIAVHGPDATLTILPPLKGETVHAYAAVDVTREPRGFAIMEDSQVKDAAFAIIEYIASPEGRMLDKLGIEGKHYTLEGDTITLTEKFPEWWNRFFETNDGLPTDYTFTTPLNSEAVLDSIAKSEEYYAEDINVLTPDFLVAQKDAMNNIYAEYYVDFITGQKDIETEWDAFVAEWNENGGDEFSEHLATVLD